MAPVTLHVDARESWWSHDHPKSNLHLGDFAICVQEEIVLLVERKTVADLLASLRDGRFREQLHRLRETPANKMYVIEGVSCLQDIVELPGIDDRRKASLETMCTNLCVRDNIPVVFTRDTDETERFILSVLKRVTKNPERYVHACASASAQHVDTLAKKTKHTDFESVCTAMLTVLPGVSPKIAHEVYQLCGRPDSLQALAAAFAPEGAQLASKLRVNGRLVSKNTCALIVKTILGTTSETPGEACA